MPDPSSTATLLFLREEELRQGMELFLYAARDLEVASEPLLTDLGLEQTHRRILHGLARRPLVTMSVLAAELRLTMQSLGRALDMLVRLGLVQIKPGLRDRRQRHLMLTDAGAATERNLARHVTARLAQAYREAGGPAVEGFRRVLVSLLEDLEERRRFDRRTLPARGA